MDVLQKLDGAEFEKPYFGFTLLARGYHKIVNFREAAGKYGRTVVAELEDEIVFLPQYLSQKLDEEDIEKLNANKESLYLYFGGWQEEKK